MRRIEARTRSSGPSWQEPPEYVRRHPGLIIQMLETFVRECLCKREVMRVWVRTIFKQFCKLCDDDVHAAARRFLSMAAWGALSFDGDSRALSLWEDCPSIRMNEQCPELQVGARRRPLGRVVRGLLGRVGGGLLGG